MLYFSNPTSNPQVHDLMAAGRLGFIDTPKQGNKRPAGLNWCADNGRYGKGWPGLNRWLRWLDRNTGDAATCWFATAPDVVGNADATLAESRFWLPVLRDFGYPAALVAQDGLTPGQVPWQEIDVLFIGGSTRWKWGDAPRALITAALERGKRVHMGRVNSGRTFRQARLLGCHSADGTFLTYGPTKNLPRMLRWHNQESQ